MHRGRQSLAELLCQIRHVAREEKRPTSAVNLPGLVTLWKTSPYVGPEDVLNLLDDVCEKSHPIRSSKDTGSSRFTKS
jgi:hypothetical protein